MSDTLGFRIFGNVAKLKGNYGVKGRGKVGKRGVIGAQNFWGRSYSIKFRGALSRTSYPDYSIKQLNDEAGRRNRNECCAGKCANRITGKFRSRSWLNFRISILPLRPQNVFVFRRNRTKWKMVLFIISEFFKNFPIFYYNLSPFSSNFSKFYRIF